MTEAARPLVTFALFAYNQERFIAEAVDSALAQTWEPLEVILSDDCSSDRTFEIMREKAAAYQGPHQVVVRRNDPNVGIAEHVNQVVAMARGEVLVVAAGDDISAPGRCAAMADAFARAEAVSFVDTATEEIDEQGAFIRQSGVTSERRQITLDQYLSGRAGPLTAASRAYRTSRLRRYPPLAKDCPTEDTPSLLRCLMLGEGLVVSEALVKRRLHETNLSGAASLRRMNFAAIQRQYEMDAEFARREGIVTRDLFKRIRSWIAHTMFLRILRQDLANGQVRTAGAIGRALTQPGLGLRTRLSALRAAATGARGA